MDKKTNSFGPLRIVMIRHGESESNVVQHHQKIGKKFEFENEISSRVDWKQRLSPKGRIQAEIGAKELQNLYGSLRFFDKLYASPFVRACETASILSGNDNFSWRIDDRLSERIWGIYGVVSRDEQRSHFPLTARLANDDPWYIRYDGGESLFDVYNRFKSFRHRLTLQSSDENVLIVAHKQLIQTACYDIEKMMIEEWDKIAENQKYNIPNLGLVEYSRVNPFDLKDIRNYYAWRRIIHLADRNSGENSEKWEEFTADKSFSASELKRRIEKYETFL